MAFFGGEPMPASSYSTSAPVVAADASVRRAARIVGVLFLAGFLTYGVGNLIATGIVDSDDRSDSTALFVTGTALMLLNSAFVIGIGVLMSPILRSESSSSALCSRECVFGEAQNGDLQRRTKIDLTS